MSRTQFTTFDERLDALVSADRRRAKKMNGRAYGEQEVIIALAGKIAERRCQQGSAPGWRRPRPRDEVVAFHEAGHAGRSPLRWDVRAPN